MPVSIKHPQYAASVARWRRNRDAVAGRDAVHAAGLRYLKPLWYDGTDEAKQRLEAYADFARWYAAPERTKNALVGSVFRKGPEKQELPTQVEYIAENADGAGVSLTQLGKELVGELLEVGRVGILTDYPPAPEGASAEEARNRLATLVPYRAEDIINWRFENIGGMRKLTLVVLAETIETDEDEFSHESELQYRVLRLVDGVYSVQVYTARDVAEPPTFPRMSDGNPWRQIPFVIIGSENNRPDVDRAPLAHLCDAAISFWRTSADDEENSHIHGQLTIGITSDMSHDDWQKFNPGGLKVGSRQGIFLGENGGFHSITAPESSKLPASLETKRLEMAELGAQIIQKGAQAQTAEASRIDAAAESSVLTNVVGNASEGIEQAIEWACGFMGGDPAAVEYALNTEFFDHIVGPQEAVALVTLWQEGAIAKADLRSRLRKGGLIEAVRTDEMIDAELDTEGPRLTGQGLDLNA